MKKQMLELYCRKCRIKPENSNQKFLTAAYKIGTAKNAQNRDTKTEFLKSLNALKPIKDEADITRDLEIKGSEDFIIELEQFIIYEYFDGEKKFFETSKEYFASYDESCKKYDNLIHVLKSKENALININLAYDELTDKQTSNIQHYHGEYNKLKDEIKNSLKKFIDSVPSMNVQTAPVIKNINNISANQKIDIYGSLLKDFILLKGQGKLMLMHKLFHKGQDPLNPRGSWKVDTTLINNPKFQFHNGNFSSVYGYLQTSVSAKKTATIFGANILDYDDPNFDKSKLPI